MRTWRFMVGTAVHTVQIAHDPLFSGELEIYLDGQQQVNQVVPRGKNFGYKCQIADQLCLIQITHSGMNMGGGLVNISCRYDVLLNGQPQTYSGVQELVAPPVVKTAVSTATQLEPSPTPPTESKPQAWSLDNLKPEEYSMVALLLNLGSHEPDTRYHAYNELDQKRYADDTLQATVSRLALEIPPTQVDTLVQLYCGLGSWLGGNTYTRPSGLDQIKQAIALAPNNPLPHTLLGGLLMGDSANAYLEQQSGQPRIFAGLSSVELGLLAKSYHQQASQELELAIRLEPQDSTPYYAFCHSQLLDFSSLNDYYRLALGRDKTHSPEFGRYHWSFATKAAKANQSSQATDAYLRAMLVEPQEYYQGPRSVRPQSGLALTCWQTAKQQFPTYQGHPAKISTLWSVPTVPLPPPWAETPPPTPRPAKVAPSRWRWILSILGIFGLSIGIWLFLSRPQPAGLPPTVGQTPLPATSPPSTATVIPPTATASPPTAIPVTATPAPGAPRITTVELRSETASGTLIIYQDVHFSDPEGDVVRWEFQVMATTNPNVHVEGGDLDISAVQQILGTVATGEWGCGDATYTVTLQVTLIDRAGHRSAPYEYTMSCDREE